MQEKKLTSVHIRIRELAKSANLKNADLARITGVSPVAVGKWFSTGQTPKAEQLLKLARHFDVSMEWLLSGDAKAESITMDGRLDSVVSWVKELMPGQLESPEEEKATREFWRNIFEGEDEKMAAAGKPDTDPDVIALAGLFESSFQEFRDNLKKIAKALGNVEIAGDPDSQKQFLRCWESLIGSVRRLDRRKSSLLAEIRAKHETDDWY